MPLLAVLAFGCMDVYNETALTISGHDSEPAVSPDGGTLAFVSTRDGIPRLWVKPIGGGSERVLTDGPDHNPRFAADGKRIFFVRREEGRQSIELVSLQGGMPQTIVRNAYRCDPALDGERIAFLRVSADSNPPLYGLWVAGSDGSQPALLYEEKEAASIADLRWSPDCLSIALVIEPEFAPSRILLVNTTTSETEGLPVEGGVLPTCVDWSENGEKVFYARQVDHSHDDYSHIELMAHDLNTGEESRLFSEWMPLSDLTVAGRRGLVYAVNMTKRSLYLIPASGSGDPELLGRSVYHQGIVSPDGSRSFSASSNKYGYLVVYEYIEHDPPVVLARVREKRSSRGVRAVNDPSRQGLYRVQEHGSEETLLFSGNCSGPRLSPNGRLVLFLHKTDARTDQSRGVLGYLRVVEVATGEVVPFEIELRASREVDPNEDWSGARWLGRAAIVFHDESGTGQRGLWVQDFAPGEDTQATRRMIAPQSDQVIESLGIMRDGNGLVSSIEQVSIVIKADALRVLRRWWY